MLKPLLIVAACLAAFPAAAGDRDSFLGERPGIGEPLRFRDAGGGAFRPRALILAGAGGAIVAKLPSGARSAQSEDRVDLTFMPLVGPLFRESLDVATVRSGQLVGPVYRVGDTLVVEATLAPTELARRPVAFATNLPRVGAVSYRLGPLDWEATHLPAPADAPIGTAHLVGGALVLASQGGEPAWPSVESMLLELF